jgi:hypothetical protein
MGDTKGGAFDLTPEQAVVMLNAPLNPNGRPNTDVLIPWINGLDITRRPRGMFIIDFGVNMSQNDASMYKLPYAHVEKEVRPERLKNNRASYRDRWWIHVEPRPALRNALTAKKQCIGTVIVAKHRLFVWLPSNAIIDHRLFIFVREDDYFFGVLHSRIHEIWSLRMGSTLEDRPSYAAANCFETFPFPWPPGQEPQGDQLVEAITDAARNLVQLRDDWLNDSSVPEADQKKRTLTNLYNARPQWLADAHQGLDVAVFAAYGWPADLSDQEILARLLELNQARAATRGAAPPPPPDDQADETEG